jgi:DNA-directed RNA polymerase subunit beta'
VTEIDGVVRFGDIKRGKREIFVTPIAATAQPTLQPSLSCTRSAQGKHLRVHEGDRVRAGDRLSEGPVNPHDILRIKGPRAVQEYLLNEVQEVYRLQGVKINDKHIGVIVRQMLQKVRVLDSGDTPFLEGEHVDKQNFRDVNEKTRSTRTSRRHPSRCCSESQRRVSRRSRSSLRRASRRRRVFLPTRQFAARGTS